MKPRSMWMTGLMSFAFLVLLVRLYQLQILQGEDYSERAENNFVKELRVPADRGLIFDRNHNLLVDSRPSYDVSITPKFCAPQCEETLSRLVAMFALSQEEVDRARQRLGDAKGLERFRPFTVKVDITREELDVFEANRPNLPGVDVMPIPHRSYRYGSVAGHLVGYMNEIGSAELKALNARIEESDSDEMPYQIGDYIGRRGIERRFEPVLRGREGVERVVVDAKGNAKSESDLLPESERGEASTPGTNLILSIDWRLQEFIEKTFPAEAGTVVAMDPKTGFLLALVDRPAPDPNKLSGRITREELAVIHSDPLQPELFRSIQQHYHPGSTFKSVTAIAALEEGMLRPNGTVFCPGYFTMGKYRWRCDKESGHGRVDLTHALGASCDVFFYTLGDRLGADRIAKWGGLAGLGRATGFDLPGEVPGIMPDEEWHEKHLRGGYHHGMAVNLSIGQGDLNVTPMQQAVLFAAIATGIVWKPQVVMRMENTKGELVKQFAPVERWRLPVKPETRAAVIEGLKAAVNAPYGTGYLSRLQDTSVVMAGKTGTAQVVKLGLKRLKASQVEYFRRDHAWFAAFAPVDNPQIVVVVINEHAGFGATHAAPTASAAVKYWLDLRLQDMFERSGVPRQYWPAPPGSGSSPAPAPPAPGPRPAPKPSGAGDSDTEGADDGA